MIEKLVGIFIPPACREEVLGDLRERNDGIQLFVYDAMRTVPMVIASRIRRTTDSVVLLMEAFCSYVSYLSCAFVVQRSMISNREDLLRMGIPCAITLTVLVVADAYANPKKKSVLRPILAVVISIAFVFLAQLMYPLLPGNIVAVGSGMSAMLLVVMRMLFPPMADRPQQAQGPAYWQKQEIVAASVLKITAGVAAGLLVVSLVPDHAKGPVLGMAIAIGAIYFITRELS